MPVDPTLEAASLVASPQEISPVEQQNRYGIRHKVISDLAPEKFLTILAIQTPRAFTESQFVEVLASLQASYGVEAMQTVFAAVIPDFGANYRNDLHLTAHLRCEMAADAEMNAPKNA